MPTPVAEEPKLTTEEVKKLATDAHNILFGDAPKTEQTEKDKVDAAAAAKAAEETKAKEEKEKADAEAAKNGEGEKPKPEEKKEPAAAPTADEIADRVAARMKPEPAKEEKPATVELSEEDQHHRNVLEFMAREKPEYAALVQRFDSFIPKEKAYRDTWEKAHPGETYNPADAEHEEFYSANDPIQTEKDQDAFDRAQTRFDARQMAEEIVDQREEEKLYAEAVKSITKRLETHEEDVTRELLKEIDPELAKVDLKKLRDEDPFAAVAIRSYTPALVAMTAELAKGFERHLRYTFSDKNPLHVTLVNKIYEYENELLAGSKDKHVLGGRTLAPIEEYNKMTPEKRAKHWSIWMEPDQVKGLLIRDFSAKAKEDLDLLRSKAGKTGKSSADSGAPKGSGDKQKTEAKDSGSKEFPNTNAGASDSSMSRDPAVIDSQDAKKIRENLFGS